MSVSEELIEYINGGDYYDEVKCYEYLWKIKWPDNVQCWSCGEYDKGFLTKQRLKLHVPYTYRCRCGQYDSATNGTTLKDMTVSSFMEVAYWIVRQKFLGRKLSNDEIKKIICSERNYYDVAFPIIEKKDAEAFEVDPRKLELEFPNINWSRKKDAKTMIGKSAVEEYRYLIQQFIIDWSFQKSYGYMPYGIICFTIKRGKNEKLIVISNQLCPNGHFRAGVFDTYSEDNIITYIKENIPNKQPEIALINWDWEYGRIAGMYPGAKAYDFSRNIDGEIDGLVDGRFMEGLKEFITKWLIKIDLSDSQRVLLHINEFLFLWYYEQLDVAELMKLIIRQPSDFANHLRR